MQGGFEKEGGGVIRRKNKHVLSEYATTCYRIEGTTRHRCDAPQSAGISNTSLKWLSVLVNIFPRIRLSNDAREHRQRHAWR